MNQPHSPFSKRQRPLAVGVDWILLVTLVSALVALLIGYASLLPSVTSEISAWMGQPASSVGTESSRRAQVTFLMIAYSAPLGLALVIRLCQLFVRWVLKATARPEDESEDQFRME